MVKSRNSGAKLARFLADNPSHPSFPDGGIDYYDRFTRVDDYINNEIHPNVNVGPTAREPIWLTDHGPEHIATVIQRAGDLVFQEECKLTPYEAYILLVAAHFHDVGNIFGRSEHEKKTRRVMGELGSTLVGTNNLEKRVICDIAMAHGGFTDVEQVDKDTIGKLPYDRDTKPNEVGVKKLAAILRFADELADDCSRTNRFIQDASNEVYPESEIYHQYADRLRAVEIDHRTRSVELHFELSTDVVAKKYKKREKDKFLFEEILERTLKMHREHVYCTRFMLPDVVLERINVLIDVCTNNYLTVLGKIPYTMAQKGYPDAPAHLRVVCPELGRITGHKLMKRVKQLVRDGVPSPYDSAPNLLSNGHQNGGIKQMRSR